MRIWFGKLLLALLMGSLSGPFAAAEDGGERGSFLKWSEAKAVEVLNQSGWARKVTFTQVVGGIGSGVSGEKEIYNAFYVRFLSARPIREAYTRIQLINHGYDSLSQEEKARFSELIRERVGQKFTDWIVVAVSFRSNDPNQESMVRQYFASQTAGTVMNRAFLSTSRFPQVRLIAYYPPTEESVGARFVFPRRIDGVEVISLDDNQVVFELTDAPGASSGGGSYGRTRRRSRSPSQSNDSDVRKLDGILRASFAVEEMVTGNQLDY